MFEGISGLPLHPLAVHAAIVLVPLLVLTALVYAVVPRWRAKVDWLAALLAVIAPLAAFVAVQSGNAFQRRLGLPLEGDLSDHRGFGTNTMWAAIALGVLTLALVLARRAGGMRWLTITLTVLVVVGAGVAATYVFLAGDLGSRIVWEETWRNATS